MMVFGERHTGQTRMHQLRMIFYMLRYANLVSFSAYQIVSTY
jgi:hypothetical protein